MSSSRQVTCLCECGNNRLAALSAPVSIFYEVNAFSDATKQKVARAQALRPEEFWIRKVAARPGLSENAKFRRSEEYPS